jgi:hypothetical protein
MYSALLTFPNGGGHHQRPDFWTTTSNKQLNFVQHVKSLLKIHGRAAVVVPDNVLFEGGSGETVRRTASLRIPQACYASRPASMPKPVKPITTEHLRAAGQDIARHFNKSVGLVRGDVAALRTEMHEEFDKVHVELEAIKELLVFRKEFENLVREIKARGMDLDETRIFVR